MIINLMGILTLVAAGLIAAMAFEAAPSLVGDARVIAAAGIVFATSVVAELLGMPARVLFVVPMWMAALALVGVYVYEFYGALGIVGVVVGAVALQALDSDDAVYILEDLDDEDQAEILAKLPFTERIRLRRSLDYPEESAGRRMQTEFVAVPPYWSVGQTIDYLRDSEDLPDSFAQVFVIVDHQDTGRCHSCLSASMGLRAAARRAGK